MRGLLPDDLVALLRFCHARTGDDATLVGSVVLKEESANGRGIYDHIVRLGITDELREEHEANDPFGPLPKGEMMYSRELLTSAFKDGGWNVEAIREPEMGLGHIAVCRRLP